MELAERTGIEPATPGVTGQYSNHLSYRSIALQWWVLQGSNLRPTACKAVALPTELNTQTEEERFYRVYENSQGFADLPWWIASIDLGANVAILIIGVNNAARGFTCQF